MINETLTDRIKREGQERGLKSAECFAKTFGNDPFNSWCRGRFGDPKGRIWKLAEWATEIFHQFCESTGKESGIHVRRIHYWLVTKGGKSKRFDGKPYTNTKKCWIELVDGMKFARYQGLVPWEAIEDKRNPKPTNIRAFDEGESIYHLDVNLDLRVSYNGPLEYHIHQPYHVEIWCEKQTVDDIIVPLIEKYDAVYLSGAGYQSATRIWEAYQRFKRIDKPCRILYISDYDLQGESMPLQVARDLEFLCTTEGELDIELEPIALTAEQQNELQLPSEPRAKGKPGEKVELDALEAFHPGYLADVVSSHLEKYRDSITIEEVDYINREAMSAMEEEADHLLDPLRERLKGFQEEVNDIIDELDEEESRIVDNLERPRSELVVRNPDIFFSSGRDYWEQWEFYRERKEND